MSSPLREATLEEGPLLRLIRDYFEHAGHAECLLALENYCKDYDQCGVHDQGLPLELSALREMALAGRWDQVGKYLSAFSGSKDKEGIQRCMYAAQRQKYFEILEHVEDNIRSKFRLGFSVPASEGIVSSSEAERTHELIEHQLSILKPLCLSPTEYQSLRDLLSLPSISSSKEFSTWQLHSGRLETFYEIGNWVSKVLYLSYKFPMPRRTKECVDNEIPCGLFRLVAKGLLYEQCEQLCRTRCGETEKEQLVCPSMLNLGGWIQQQPDSSFQIPPTEIQLVLRPLSKSISPEVQISHSVDMGMLYKDKAMLNDRMVTTLPPVHLSLVGEKEEKVRLSGEVAFQKAGFKVATGFTEGVENRNLDLHMKGVEGRVNEDELVPPIKPSMREGVPKEVHRLPPCTSASQVKVTTCDSGVGKEQQDNSNQLPVPSSSPVRKQMFPIVSEDAHLPCNTPLSKGNLGRDSSTPRNCRASHGSLKVCPPSSPILFAPPGPSYETTSNSSHLIPISVSGPTLAIAPGISHTSDNSQFPGVSTVHHVSGHTSTTTHLLPHISETPSSNFGRNITSTVAPGPVRLGTTAHGNSPATPIMLDGDHTTKMLTSTSFCWPSVTMLGSISDPQVVRSVAFSGSGKMVAIGANSRMLRLCYTATLLEKKKSMEELEIFYQHPRYHKSSIYCMAWLNDTVLASGSNDQTIRLLTCSPDNKFRVQKPLLLHKGTIRDLVFTHEGLLVSGGGGSPHVKVTDVKTCQNVLSLAGHTDQVLALGVLPGGLVVSGGQDNTVLLWDLRTHLPITSISLSSPVTSLSVCGEGLVTAHSDGSCFIHELKSYQCTASYIPHIGECRTVRFCPDRSRTSWVLSGSYDGTVCLAEVTAALATVTERVQWTKLCQHSDKVIQCRWHPDGHMFASTGADKKACFWRI